MQSLSQFEVLIVGAGPVGMMLAMQLDRFGIPCALIDKETHPPKHPKGSNVNHRTMEIFRRLGIAQEIRKLGLPSDFPTDVGYFTRLNEFEIARIPMPSEVGKRAMMNHPAPDFQIVEPLLKCNQMYLEAFLRDHIKTLKNVTLKTGWKCDAFTEETNGVEIEISNGVTGEKQKVSAGYLVGCDGGKSFVRQTLGIEYEGAEGLKLAFHGGPMLASHIRIKDFYTRVTAKVCWQYWIINSKMRAMFIALNGRDEFTLFSRLNSIAEKLDLAAITAQLHEAVGIDLEVEIVGQSPWTAGLSLVAEKFRHGRVFLAGDSVHIFTPSGGFGMNTGMEDANNLGWKLSACIQGWGGEKLLMSYEDERKPVAVRNTTAAKHYSKRIGSIVYTEAVEKANEAGERERKVLEQVLTASPHEYNSIGIELGGRYDQSPAICQHNDVAPPSDNEFFYQPSCKPGGRAPNLWFSQDHCLFDAFGPWFTLLCLNPETSPNAMLVAAKDLGIPLKVQPLDHPTARQLYACDFALIRPDDYVAWLGDDLTGCREVLMQLAGREPN